MPLQNKIDALARAAQADPLPTSRKWTAYNSTDAALHPQAGVEVRFEKGFTVDFSKFVLSSTDPFHPTRHHSLTVKALKDIAWRIDDAYMTTTYRSCMSNPAWRTMFQVGPRSVKRIVGTTVTATFEDTMPCYRCGLLLPLDQITIDHDKPQSGGGEQAVLKVLRNISQGLTHAPGVGGVASSYRSGVFAALPTRAGGAGGGSAEGREARYTLTEKGMLFLSVATAASSSADVSRYCMHSLFNLKPYCAKCNIAKSNTITDLSWINTEP